MTMIFQVKCHNGQAPSGSSLPLTLYKGLTPLSTFAWVKKVCTVLYFIVCLSHFLDLHFLSSKWCYTLSLEFSACLNLRKALLPKKVSSTSLES